MAKMGLSIPIKGAEYYYEFRDTLGTWSNPQLLPFTLNLNTGFTFPLCDEIRITSTFDQSETVNRVHMSALSIYSGLTYSSNIPSTPAAQPTISRPQQNAHNTLRTGDYVGSTPEFTITGVAQRRLDMRHFFFGRLEWQPECNYLYGNQEGITPFYSRSQTLGSDYQQEESTTRDDSLSLEGESEDSILDLSYLIKWKTFRGFCLFERDIDDSTNRQDYMWPCNASTTKKSNPFFEKHDTSLNIQEAFTE